MGYWYWRPLKSAWVMDEDTTNSFMLPNKGHLSGLFMKLRAVNAAGNYAYDNLWPAQRTSFRVVGNGNREIIDVRGRQLDAINYWDTGVMPRNVLWDDVSGTMEQYLTVPFGRKLADERYGLILNNFDTGVEFEETNTYDTTYVTDGSQRLDIWGLFRKNPEGNLFNGGYLTKKQIINKDTASEAQYPVKLPTENKLRQIHMFTEPDLSNTPATGPFTNLSRIWLGIKSKEEYILDNAEATIWARIIHQHYGRKPKTEGITKVHASNANYFDTMLYERDTSQLTAMGTTTGILAHENSATFWERICRVYANTDASAGVSAYVYVTSSGICLHGNIPLLMQDPQKTDETQWIDSKANGDMYVEFTEGASTGNIYIVLDELQKEYPK